MPTIKKNFDKWNNTYKWEKAGDEWSGVWGSVDMQWYGTLLPRIQGFLPAENVLEIAPGFGRWTDYLRKHCKKLIGIDLAKRCIDHCRDRFVNYPEMTFYQNDGKNLEMVANNSIDFVFSFDSLVHVEIDVLDAYLSQLSKIMRQDAIGFFHHSNRASYKELENNPEFHSHWRAQSVSYKIFQEICEKHGFCCISQELINWSNKPEWSVDCISVFTKIQSKYARENRVFQNQQYMMDARHWKPLSKLYDIRVKSEVIENIDPLVSIIIPVWNKVALTKQCIENLTKNTSYSNYEIIIVDNNSTDETPQYLKTLLSNIKVITNKENLGFAKATNQGAKQAIGDYLVLLNNDTIPLTGWLTNLVKTIKQENVGIVGAKLLYEDDSIQHCGVVLRRDRKFFKHPYKFVERDHKIVNQVREWDAVTAACLITPKSLYFKLGLLDEEYLNGCEDIDYCCAVRNAGYKIIYQPKSELYHLESQTPRKIDSNDANFCYFIQKWGDNAIKLEHEIYLEDKFWIYDAGLYTHNYNDYVNKWQLKFEKAQLNGHDEEKDRIQKLFRHLYTNKDWVEVKSDLPRSYESIYFSKDQKFVNKSKENRSIEKLDEVHKSSALTTTIETVKLKKILFICHDFPPYRMAGAQLYARNLAQKINSEGLAKVEILHPVFRDEDERDYYTIRQNNKFGLNIYEYVKPLVKEPQKVFDGKIEVELTKFLLENNYDVIHFHGLGQFTLVPVFVAKSLNIETIMTFHDYWFLCDRWHMIRKDQSICSGPESIAKCSQCYVQDNNLKNDLTVYRQAEKYHKYRKDLFKKAFFLIDHKFAPSKYLTEVFSNFGFDGIKVDPLGFEYKEVKRVDEDYSLKTKIIFGYSGQIIARKGVNHLIEAFKTISSENIELHIWGRIDKTKKYSNMIIKLAEDDPRIKLFGEYKPADLEEIYKSFDIAVISSLMENYPLVVQEAFINKVPVITSGVGGIPEAVIDGKNGLIVEPGNISSYKNAIERIIANPNLINKFRKNIKTVKTLKDDAIFFSNIYNKEKPVKSTEGITGKYRVQFYVFKNVHWPMFDEIFNYLKTRDDVGEIIICIPDLPQVIGNQNYSFVFSLFDLGVKVVNDPREIPVDVTFIADTIAGKVKGCGKIVNVGHGTISKGYYFTESVWTERENWVDLLCVPGNYAKEQFEKVLNTKVVATGMPKLDPVFSGTFSKKRLCENLRLDKQKKIILYAPTFNIDLSSIYDFANEFHRIHSDDYYVLMKFHGSTQPNMINHYMNLAKNYPNFIFIEDPNLAPYLGGSDIMISDVSSAFMEFMSLDKPVILYNNPKLKSYHGYQEDNIEYKWRNLGTEVSSFDQLASVLPTILYGDNKNEIRKKYAKQLFSDMTGKASENVWNETLAILNDKSFVDMKSLAITLKLNNENLFAVREKVHNIQFYSVMPIEMIIVIEQNSDRITGFINSLTNFNQFFKLKVIENTSNKDSYLVGKELAKSDYIMFLHESAILFKNFDYMIYKTFKNHPEINYLTGVTDNEDIKCENYVKWNNFRDISRYAYEFIWKYEGKVIENIALTKVPNLTIIRKNVTIQEDSIEEHLEKYLKLNQIPMALSLFYRSIPVRDFSTIKTLYSRYNQIKIDERVKMTTDVIKEYFYSDLAELLWRDYLNMNIQDDQAILKLMLNSCYTRYYDYEYKKELVQYLTSIPKICDSMKKELKLIELLSGNYNGIKKNKCRINKEVNDADSDNFSSKKILFYFFKNVHIPILKPIYEKYKELYPNDEIAFGVMQYAPQIRAGFLPEELKMIESLGEKIYSKPQDFKPDLTFIADSVYPWVQGCGKLVHVGHGILSKGQYYTNTDTARREEQADLVCVPGDYHAKIMKNIISKPVIASGMAKLDKLFAGQVSKESICEKYGLPIDAKYVLFAPTFNDELSAIPFVMDRIQEVISDNNTFLIIKLHGSTKQEYRDMYKKLVELNSHVIYADREEIDITPYLALCDVMISDVSSAMIEFAALDKPVVLFNNPNRFKYENYNENDIEYRFRNIGIQTSNLNEIKRAVKISLLSKEINQKNRQEATDKLLANKNKFNASKIIVEEARKLLQ
jgi:GT2 family glycosyltransferase/CDP-glycerol glycerophosphotransferase (TagB/SpsB family)/glycosyltransferase involved in cell wall biosynthesis